MDVHWLDHVVAWNTARTRRTLFSDGWGDEDLTARWIASRAFERPVRVPDVHWTPARIEGRVITRDGRFLSPVTELPAESRACVFRAVMPANFTRDTPMLVVHAASGDEGFATRTRVWLPAIERGALGVLLPENALYGVRRPFGQRGTGVRTVSAHLGMNIAMVLEARALLAWLEHEGFAVRGVAGFSMGGSMAALTAAIENTRLAVAVLAAGRSASPVFTRGLLSRSVDFVALSRSFGHDTERARAALAELFAHADLDRFAAPAHRDGIALVAATRDGYVPADEVRTLQRVWGLPDAAWMNTGHAGAIVHHAHVMREHAVNAIARMTKG
jgi:hypothetical protein